MQNTKLAVHVSAQTSLRPPRKTHISSTCNDVFVCCPVLSKNPRPKVASTCIHNLAFASCASVYIDVVEYRSSKHSKQRKYQTIFFSHFYCMVWLVRGGGGVGGYIIALEKFNVTEMQVLQKCMHMQQILMLSCPVKYGMRPFLFIND